MHTVDQQQPMVTAALSDEVAALWRRAVQGDAWARDALLRRIMRHYHASEQPLDALSDLHWATERLADVLAA